MRASGSAAADARGALMMVVLAAGVGSCSGRPSMAPPGIAAPARPGGVTVIARESSYDITGSTPEELAEAMRTNGPGEEGELLVGYQSWNVRWAFGTDGDAIRCPLTSARVTVRSTITMPQWRDREEADPALIADWNRFLDNLWVHQYGHRAIAYRAAEEMLRQLQRFEGQPCDVYRAVNERARQILARYRERMRIYDEETDATPAGADGWYWPPADTTPEAGSGHT